MGQLIFQATLGGQVALVGPNTASSYTLNIPTVNGNLVTTGDTGTVTNTMLVNSSLTIGSTAISLGGTSTTLAGLTGLTSSVITDSGLTSGRVTYASTGGLLVDSANLTFNGTTLTTAGLSDSGNLTFTGTGNRITGDFSNTTNSSRVSFQTSTTNGNTILQILPNGTGNASGFTAGNNSDINNASLLSLNSLSTEARILATITGTGSYLPITMYTGGSERLRIDTSGNVYIGATVNNVFDQVGAARPLLVQKSDTSTTLGGSTASITISNGDTTTSNTAQLNFAAITGASTSQYSSAIISAIFGARTNAQYPTGQLAFLTSSTLNAAPSEKMRITSAGNVGIGTSSPTGLLDVYSTGNTDAYIRGLNATRLYITGGPYSWNIGSNYYVIGALTFTNGSGTTTTTMLDNGNVGIGTTSPSTKLHVEQSTTGDAFKVARGGNYIIMGGSGSGTQYIKGYEGVVAFGNEFAGATTFLTSNTERMRIDSSGNVGIGTSSPGKKLDILDSAATSTTPFANQIFQLRSNGSGADATIQFTDSVTYNSYFGSGGGNFYWNTTGAERMRISSAGIVTMSAYGAGAATFSATGVISSVSDETWKTKDGVPTNTDAMLQKLEPGYWFYNEEKAPTFGEERQLGFYAQNVHEAIGEEAAPTPQEGKPWGYHDRSVLAIAVMSLKNALNTIEELKQRIETLENK